MKQIHALTLMMCLTPGASSQDKEVEEMRMTGGELSVAVAWKRVSNREKTWSNRPVFSVKART